MGARPPPGDRLVYQVVRDGQTRAVPVALRRAEVADRLWQAWGTILFVVALFVVVLFPRPWSPLTRHPRLLWVVCATPAALVVALALAALGGVGPLVSIDDRDQSEVVSRWPRCSADVGS